MSIEAATKIITIRAYYIQFKTFTHLRVVGTQVKPKKLSRYLLDRLILLEIVRKLTSAYERVRK